MRSDDRDRVHLLARIIESRLGWIALLALLVRVPPATAATIVVNDGGDALHACASSGLGTCTLRDAMTFANANAGADQIQFAIPGPGVHKIVPASALPNLTDDAGVFIDGYSQPGSSPNGQAIGDNAVILIEIDASSIPSGMAGAIGVGSSNNRIRGLVIHDYGVADCIAVVGDNNVVEGNFLGTDPTGTIARPCRGALLVASGSGNVIGGTEPASRNVMAAGSLNVLDLVGGGTAVQGNYVGTDRTGTLSLGSPFHGVTIQGDGNVIGGDAAGAGNLISGNGNSIGQGVLVFGSSNTIAGNLIGTNATGVAPIPNGGNGIFLGGNSSGNSIRGNRIAFNTLAGVRIGDFADSPAVRNSITQNRIWANTGQAIDLGGDGVTPDDPCDADSGANELQNFPVLFGAVSAAGFTRIRGTLDSSPDSSYVIEFFSSSACHRSGHGPGQVFLGSTLVATDASCQAVIDVVLPVTLGPRDQVTATATDAAGNTSEFSPCASVAADYFTLAPCRVADTRDPPGPFGGPALVPGSGRIFVIAGSCGIPASAQAVSFNFTVTQPGALGGLRVSVPERDLPLASILNWDAGQTRANNAVLPLGAAGDLLFHVDGFGTVQLIIDVSGYFE